MLKIINFDHNSSTKIAPSVLQKMIEVYDLGANSAALHKIGRKSAMIVEEARQNLSDALNAKNYEIYFTSGGTEANNMAVFGDNYEKIFLTKIEHGCVYNAAASTNRAVEIAVDKNGIIDLQDLEQKINQCQSKNFLVALMHANNETGAIQPIKEAAKITHQKGGVFLSDMVQSFGKMAIDLEDYNVDFATVSSHKINGPQGVGAILVRRGIDIKPMIFGNGHEKGKRAGTLNTPAIAGFGEAIKLLPQRILAIKKTAEIRDFIESKIKNIAKDNAMIFSSEVPRLDNTSFVAIRCADSQTQLINFDLNNIMVSSGAACSSGTSLGSRTLLAMNASKDFLGAIRISLSPDNTRAEAERFIEIWQEFYARSL